MEVELDFLINKADPDVSICAPSSFIQEYEDAYEIAVIGCYGKYYSKDEWDYVPWDSMPGEYDESELDGEPA